MHWLAERTLTLSDQPRDPRDVAVLVATSQEVQVYIKKAQAHTKKVQVHITHAESNLDMKKPNLHMKKALRRFRYKYPRQQGGRTGNCNGGK